MQLKFRLIILSVIFSSVVNAQKVGLVLSGGGAKGITHIGVIKALEENNIPIDYIAGTSMGAIVGGYYAMGFSPDELIEILKSDEFRYLSTGEIEPKYRYFYLTPDPKPSLIEFPLNVKKLDSLLIKPTFLPTNLISPHQMNFAFMNMFTQANTVAGGDFDKLFVPFRCVASDIYGKQAVVFNKGKLGDAIRASMTYPFVYKPISIDGKLLFDGGIYNNFPVNVMRDEFKPDYIIGSNVSTPPQKPDESDLIQQIMNMVMTKTDNSISKEEGLLLDFNLDKYMGFDFSKVDELVQIGYDSTMKYIDEIKNRISRRAPQNNLSNQRYAFRNTFPELKFQNVEITGIDSAKHWYIEQFFHNKNEVFSLSEFKEAYFKLFSDNKILEVVPNAVYNRENNNYDLHLKVKMSDHIKLMLGGNISTSTSNQAYFGVNYQNLSEFPQSAWADVQFGKNYNGFGLGTRIEAPTRNDWYMKLAVVLHKFDYYEGNRLFFNDYRTANFNQYEAYGKLSVGVPIKLTGKLETGFGYGVLIDNYAQLIDTVGYPFADRRSLISLGTIFTRATGSTLNNLMYPTSGYQYNASMQFLHSFDLSASGFDNYFTNPKLSDNWMQLKGKYERYFPVNKKITLGAYSEITISTRKLLDSYTATMIQFPAFQPTPHSKIIYNPAYRANQFMALGIKPIYQISNQLHFRNELYWFVPYQTLKRTSADKPYYSSSFQSTNFLTESSLVLTFKNITASMYLNYYNSGTSRVNFGVNIGLLLFNDKFLD